MTLVTRSALTSSNRRIENRCTCARWRGRFVVAHGLWRRGLKAHASRLRGDKSAGNSLRSMTKSPMKAWFAWRMATYWICAALDVLQRLENSNGSFATRRRRTIKVEFILEIWRWPSEGFSTGWKFKCRASTWRAWRRERNLTTLDGKWKLQFKLHGVELLGDAPSGRYAAGPSESASHPLRPTLRFF